MRNLAGLTLREHLHENFCSADLLGFYNKHHQTAISKSTEAALFNSASSKIQALCAGKKKKKRIRADLCHYKSACLLTCMHAMRHAKYFLDSAYDKRNKTAVLSAFFLFGQVKTE